MNTRIELDRAGFAVVPEAIEPSRVDELISALAALGTSYGLRNLLRRCPAVRRLAHDLKPFVTPCLGERAFAVRGLLFDKLPGANWEVAWHQDLSIAVAERRAVPGFTGWSVKQGVPHVQPPAGILEQMLTVRVHLDDCSPANGPLRVLPGSHQEGRLSDAAIERWKQRQPVQCWVGRGGLVLLRPLLLHASSRAERPSHRRVIHLEYAFGPLPGGLRWYEEDTATAENAVEG